MKTKAQIENERNQLVVKSNELIQKTRYTLTLQQQKIILYLISKIKPDDDDLQTYEFNLSDLCEVCGIEHHGQNYKNFKDSIKKLHDSSFWLSTPTNGEYLISWVSDVAITYNGTPKVRVRLNQYLQPYLLHLRSQFTAYELGSVLLMKSKYSIRIYELLRSYVGQGVAEFSLSDFREKLGLITEYTDYRNFKRYVIDVSMKEINEFSDINVQYEAIKRGKVVGVHFLIQSKTQEEIDLIRVKRDMTMNAQN